MGSHFPAVKIGSQKSALLLRFTGIVTGRDGCLTAEHFISTRMLCKYIGRLCTQELGWWTGRIRIGVKRSKLSIRISGH